MPELPSAKWTIERVELVLFNLEHKRWQIWWERSLANLEVGNDEHATRAAGARGTFEPFRSGALYRRQIIRLLDTARKIVSAVVADPFSMAASPGEEKPLNKIMIEGEQPAQDFWPLFLKYCHGTCEKYGIHSLNVKAFLNHPDALTPGSVFTTTGRSACRI